MSDHSDLIQRLRDSANGRYFWRCLHKIDKSMRIQFEDWEGQEAKEWFKEQLSRFPDSYRDYEMVRVHVLDQSDKLMIEAAEALEKMRPKLAVLSKSIDIVELMEDRLRELQLNNPDSIATFEADGQTRYQTVNEWVDFVLKEIDVIVDRNS